MSFKNLLKAYGFLVIQKISEEITLRNDINLKKKCSKTISGSQVIHENLRKVAKVRYSKQRYILESICDI